MEEVTSWRVTWRCPLNEVNYLKDEVSCGRPPDEVTWKRPLDEVSCGGPPDEVTWRRPLDEVSCGYLRMRGSPDEVWWLDEVSWAEVTWPLDEVNWAKVTWRDLLTSWAELRWGDLLMRWGAVTSWWMRWPDLGGIRHHSFKTRKHIIKIPDDIILILCKVNDKNALKIFLVVKENSIKVDWHPTRRVLLGRIEPWEWIYRVINFLWPDLSILSQLQFIAPFTPYVSLPLSL